MAAPTREKALFLSLKSLPVRAAVAQKMQVIVPRA
jgi:hypothetical protein